jgi:hypothetical protein
MTGSEERDRTNWRTPCPQREKSVATSKNTHGDHCAGVKQQILESGIPKQDAVLGAELALERRKKSTLKLSSALRQQREEVLLACALLVAKTKGSD